MKIFYIPLLLLAMAIPTVNVHAEFEPPTEGQLDQLLANPQLINITIKGANGQEAAGVVIRIIERLQKVDLVDVQLKYLVAYYTAKVAFLLPTDEAKDFATELVANCPKELTPSILAALSIGAGGIQAFGDHLFELAGDIESYVESIRNPQIPLTPPVYNLLISALGTGQSLPPVVTDSLPPPIPVGDTPSAPAPAAPPIAVGYAGQTGGN
jgi:hypothetical protein